MLDCIQAYLEWQSATQIWQLELLYNAAKAELFQYTAFSGMVKLFITQLIITSQFLKWHVHLKVLSML